eukprot:scaffold118754_cov72-Phaeocystis_antarctica.AAC.1
MALTDSSTLGDQLARCASVMRVLPPKPAWVPVFSTTIAEAATRSTHGLQCKLKMPWYFGPQ